jgi:two-component system chemotaxis response regulator CheY
MMAATILIVEDSRTMRLLLRCFLVREGHVVHEAEDGVEALEWLASNDRPDLLITDINMPRLDGFGLIEQLRTRTEQQDLPILVLSTEGAEQKRNLANRLGVLGWFVKPFEADVLRSAISGVLH